MSALSTQSLTAGTAKAMQGMLRKVTKAGSAVSAMAGSSGAGQQATANAGIVHGQVLNCYKAVQEYLTRMVTTVPGMKSLLLDPETVRPRHANTIAALVHGRCCH